MAAYARTTFAQLKARLADRVGGQERFWTAFEFEMAINEALNVWQLLVGEFSYSAQMTTYQDSFDQLYAVGGTTGTCYLKVVESTADAPYPLSVWRVGRDTATHTTGSLYAFPKLVQASVLDLDNISTSWVTTATATADYWCPAGVNRIVWAPVPNTPVRVDYYRGDRLLDDDADYVQLGDEELNRILDYAVWQLNVKSGTEEAFNNTNPLKGLFGLAAKLRNQKLRQSQLYKDVMGGDYGEAQPSREAAPQAGGRGPAGGQS